MSDELDLLVDKMVGDEDFIDNVVNIKLDQTPDLLSLVFNWLAKEKVNPDIMEKDLPYLLRRLAERVIHQNKTLLNNAYYERNMLALMMASKYYIDPKDGWKVLVIETKDGEQLTFHVPPDFNTYRLPEVDPSVWDGHTTEEKWKRVEQHMQECLGVRWFRE